MCVIRIPFAPLLRYVSCVCRRRWRSPDCLMLLCPQFVEMSSRGGRIRVTDDSFATVGANVEVRTEHTSALNDTKKRESANKTRVGHRNRLKNLIAWWRTEYPDYFEAGTRVLPQEERDDPMMFYHTCDRDIVYEGIRVAMVLAYMAGNKFKENGKLYTHGHMRKLHDAILFGARTANMALPSVYYSEMETFLASFKKEEANAKSEGNVDERTADPISFSLFRQILMWALNSGNIFLWVWTISQWNLMARSISIDPLALHNIGVCEDRFMVKHDSTKTDKKGEKLHNKGVYCNPLDPVVCFGVGMGVWLCLEQDSFEDSERIFLRGDAKVGSAAHRYCSQLLQLLKANWESVKTFIKTLSAHGLRKGSATHVASATTVPPPIASIANRGDWSLGKVLDIYWQFAEAGDSYLGRCLAGMDPNTSEFSVLPPHWITASPMEDDDIKEALDLMYGTIMQSHPNMSGVLLRLLASVVHASDWIKEVSASKPGHPFGGIPILQNPVLLARLKTKVTLEPTESMRHATGVPPHVAQLNLMTSLLQLCQTTLQKVNDQATLVRQSIFDAMEERAIDNGQISREQIVGILDEFRQGIRDDVSQQITALQANGIGRAPEQAAPGTLHQGPGQGVKFFAYAGKAWDVPQNFEFPKGIKRNAGWKLWIQGMPGNSTVGENGALTTRAIKPFRLFVPSRMPKKIADTFKLHWRPIFAMMEEGLENIPQNPTAAQIDELYDQATEYLKTRVAFVFENPKMNEKNWMISTWAKNVKRSMIMAKGTEQDKANLPEENRFNQGHTGRTRQVTLQFQTRVPRRNVATPTAATPPTATAAATPTNPTTATQAIIPPRTAAARRPRSESDGGSGGDSSSDSDNELPPREQAARRKRRREFPDDGGVSFSSSFALTELSELSASNIAKAKEVDRRLAEEEEEDRKETAEEARRRKANANNGLSVRRNDGKNKGANDRGYRTWLQKASAIFPHRGNESSDHSDSG